MVPSINKLKGYFNNVRSRYNHQKPKTGLGQAKISRIVNKLQSDAMNYNKNDDEFKEQNTNREKDRREEH